MQSSQKTDKERKKEGEEEIDITQFHSHGLMIPQGERKDKNYDKAAT